MKASIQYNKITMFRNRLPIFKSEDTGINCYRFCFFVLGNSRWKINRFCEDSRNVSDKVCKRNNIIIKWFLLRKVNSITKCIYKLGIHRWILLINTTLLIKSLFKIKIWKFLLLSSSFFAKNMKQDIWRREVFCS